MGEPLKFFKAGIILLCTILYIRRESVIMILCIVWRIYHVRALGIVASHESCCLNGKYIMEESDVLNRNRQHSGIPTSPLTW